MRQLVHLKTLLGLIDDLVSRQILRGQLLAPSILRVCRVAASPGRLAIIVDVQVRVLHELGISYIRLVGSAVILVRVMARLVVQLEIQIFVRRVTGFTLV